MKLLTFLALCIIVSSQAALHNSHEEEIREWDYGLSAKELADSQWEEFKLTYNKKYATEAEELHRKKIFLKNSIEISEANQRFAQGLAHNQQEINKFADLTHAEILKTYTNCFRGYETYLASNATEKFITFLPPAHVKIADSVDWREKGAVTAVKDQETCGSCYSFSATGSLEGQHFRKDEELVSLSEQNLIDCSGDYGNAGCEGGLPSSSFEYIRDNEGIDTEESYPYENDFGECRYKPENKGATDHGVAKVKRGSEDELKAAVASAGPIAVGIDANHMSFHRYKAGKVYYEPKCSSRNLGHAVLIVGYGTDPEDSNPDYWIVKNSWGEGWGEDGYIKMARNKHNHCGIATFATYPLV